MGWWVHLVDDHGHDDGSWNYTHNCSSMIYAVLVDAGIELAADTRPCSAMPIDPATGHLTFYPNGLGTISWWEHLDGMSGADGAAFLHVIVSGLEANPERFRAMSPSNGWGDYDSFLKTLTEMRDAVPEWPTVWSASG